MFYLYNGSAPASLRRLAFHMMNHGMNGIKKTILCAGISNYSVDTSRMRDYLPKAGDVAVFEVVSRGKHKSVQIDSGRNASIFPGDRFMAVFGNRYATNQYEGYVPTEPLEKLHILGQGGVVGVVRSAHSAMPRPTVVKIVGYVVDPEGKVINSKCYNKKLSRFSGAIPPGARVILSVGASMDSGKTTTAGYLARSLKGIGKKVAYLKLTGTAYKKDTDFVSDCGADFVSDFSEVGFPSTYLCEAEELMDLYQTLLESASAIRPDDIIVEIADGLYQRETSFLLKNGRFLSTVYAVLFSCGDSLSAVSGIQFLTAIGARPAAVCGVYTMSPLLIEEVRSVCDVKTATLEEILTPEFAHYIQNAGRAVGH